MSELTPTAEEVEIVENASSQQTKLRTGRENPSDLFSSVEKIREALGIVEGEVALTVLDDRT